MKKKLVFFSLFSCMLLFLMPMISGIELDILRNEFEERCYRNIKNIDMNLDFFKNIDLGKINYLLIIIKILIFLEIGFDLFLLIYSLLNDPFMLIANFFTYVVIGLIIFPNSIISFFDSILRGDIEGFMYFMKLYVIGVLILFFIEINPTLLNYLIGSISFGFIIYVFQMSIF